MRSMDAPENGRVESRLQLVEGAVIRRARVLARDDGNGFVGQRRIENFLRLHQQKPFTDLDGEPFASTLALGDEPDDLLELIGGDRRRAFGAAQLSLGRDTFSR